MARLTSTGINFDILDPTNNIESFYWIYPAGTRKLFYQATAPTGWTQVTTHNNKALRVVNGTGGGSGGSSSWTSVLSNSANLGVTISGTFPISGSVGGHTLSLSQLPNHTHPSTFGPAGGAGATPFSNTGNRLQSGSNATGGMGGGGGSHDHPWSGSVTINENTSLSVNLGVQYVNVILCSLN